MRYFSEETVRKIMREVNVRYVSSSQYDTSLCSEERTYPDLNKFPSVEIDSGWHTGTPTEEGWYLCWVKFEKGNENAIVYYWDNHEWSIVPRFYLASNDIILAWMPIEPYKED